MNLIEACRIPKTCDLVKNAGFTPNLDFSLFFIYFVVVLQFRTVLS